MRLSYSKQYRRIFYDQFFCGCFYWRVLVHLFEQFDLEKLNEFFEGTQTGCVFTLGDDLEDRVLLVETHRRPVFEVHR